VFENAYPWNFDSFYRHAEVKKIKTPVDMNKAFLANDDAVCLLKDYIDAVYSGDFSMVED